MQSTAPNVEEYLASLPDDRRDAIRAVREAVNARLPAGYEERIQYGMIAWVVPESALPAASVYNQQLLCLANLGSQKSHMALYLMGVYGDEQERAWFEAAYKKAGKKLDMGKSCVRFRSLDAVPLDVISEAMSRISVERYVTAYHAIRAATKAGSSTAATAPKSTPVKVAPAKAVPAKAASAAPTKAGPAKSAPAKSAPARSVPVKAAAKSPPGKSAATKGAPAKSGPASKSGAKQDSGSAKRR